MRYRDGPDTTDVVGRVLTADESGLRLERRTGEVAFVPAGTVLAMKVVPDRPRRTRPARAISAEDLTRVASRGWPAIESVALGEWELRASGGFTGRANSVAVHGDPGVADPFSTVEDFHRTRRLRPLAQVVEGSAWDRRFTEAGWRPVTDQPPGAIVQVADLPVAPPPDEEVVVSDRASDAWLAHYGRVDDLTLARAVLEGPSTVAFLSLADVAIGRVVVTGEWAGLAAVEVDPSHRRQGLARRIVDTALAWAHDHGADKVYLQTVRSNEAALALYAAYGFTTHHAYRYLTSPSGGR